MKILYLLFCFVFLVSGWLWGQTYHMNVIGSCSDGEIARSSNGSINIYVKQGASLRIEYYQKNANDDILPPNCTRSTMLYNGVNGPTVSTSGNKSYITISNFSSANMGYYNLGTDNSCARYSFNLILVSEPSWELQTVSDICHSSAEPNTTKIIVKGPSIGNYTWSVVPTSSTSNILTTGTLTSPSSNNQSATSTINSSDITPPNPAQGPYTLVATYKDGNNCIWNNSKPIRVHIDRPYTNYAGVNNIYTHTLGNSAYIDPASDITADFNSNAISPVSTISSFNMDFSNISVTRNSGTTVSLPSSRYILPTVAGTTNLKFSADYNNCTYTQNFDLIVAAGSNQNSNAIIFENKTTTGIPAINSNKEGCKDDEVMFTFRSSSNTLPPLYISTKGSNNSTVLIPLMALTSVNGTRNYTVPAPSLTITNKPVSSVELLKPAYYYKDAATEQITLYIKLYEEIKSGSVGIHYDFNYHPSSTQELGSINVHSPILDFNFPSTPLCSKSSIPIFPSSPVTGVFSVQKVDLDTNTSSPLYNAVDFANSSLVQNINGAIVNNVLQTSLISFGSNNEKAGALLKITFIAENVRYTTGDACPNTTEFKKEKIYPIFNNNNVSFTLPSVETATTSGGRLQLNSTTWTEYIVDDKAIFTPNLNQIVSNPSTIIFSGQWIQDSIRNGDVIQIINSRIEEGDYTIVMTAENNGCEVKGTGVLRAIQKTPFDNLPTQLCNNAGVISFKRPTHTAYRIYEGNNAMWIWDAVTNAYSYTISEGYEYTNYSLSNIIIRDVTTTPTVILDQYTNIGTQIVITDKNLSTESITIDFDNYSIPLNSEIEIIAEFQMITKTYLPDNGMPYTSTSYTSAIPANFSVIPNDSTFYISHSNQRCKFDLSSMATIDGLPSHFCASNTTGIEIITTPAYASGFSTYKLSLVGGNGASITLPSNTLTKNSFESLLSQNSNVTSRDFLLEYEYRASDNCTARGSHYVNYVSTVPAEVYRTGYPIENPLLICRTAAPIVLQSNPSNAQLSHSAITMDNNSYIFNPNQLQQGIHTVNVEYTDILGCIHQSTKNISVSNVAPIILTVNGSVPLSSLITLCQNNAAVALGASYNGNVINDIGVAHNAQFKVNNSVLSSNIFNPGSVASAIVTPIVVPIEFTYNAPDGCVASSTINATINPSPNIDFRTTNIGNNALPIDICANEAPFWIVASVNGMTPTGTSTFQSNGVSNSGITSTTISGYELRYSVEASLARTSPTILVDTVKFINTNNYGCEDSSIYLFNIKPLPQIDITNLDTAYCGNDGVVQLNVSPSPNSNTVRAYSFLGAGIINDPIASPELVYFDPSVLYNGSPTSVDIKYIVENVNSCRDTFVKTVRIKDLPKVNLGLPTSICINDDSIPLTIISLGTTNYYTLTGPIIDSVVGGVNNVDYLLRPSQLTSAGVQSITVNLTSSEACINTQIEELMVFDKPTAQLRNIDTEHYLCVNNSVEADGIPLGGDFIYSATFPGGHNQSISRMSINPNGLAGGTVDTLSYIYTDANSCKDTVSKRIHFIELPAINSVNLVDSVCQIPGHSEIINVSYAANSGISINCTGQGVNFDGTNWRFTPSWTYTGLQSIVINATRATLATSLLSDASCTASFTETIKVNPLPIPATTSLRNDTVLCNTNPIINLVANSNGISNYIFRGNGIDSTMVFDTIGYLQDNTTGYFYPVVDTIHDYVFNPALINITSVRQYVTLEAFNIHGCTDTLRLGFDVHVAPETYFEFTDGRSSRYSPTPMVEVCESDGDIRLFPTPGGGSFYLHHDQTSPNTSYSIIAPDFNPNPNYLADILLTDKYDTITYTVTTNSVCTTHDTMLVRIKPIPRPQLAFYSVNDPNTAVNHICLGGDDIVPRVNLANGVYTPVNVIRNGFLNPNILGLGSSNYIYYTVDSSNGCSHTDVVQLTVSNMPVVQLHADPGCATTNIEFNIDSLGLNENFEHISAINWNFGDGHSQVTSHTINEALVTIPNTTHTYVAGTYSVILTVTNNNYCTASDTIRLVVSPYEVVTPSNAYLEDFIDDDGAWFDEKEGSNEPSNLWHWAPITAAPMGRPSTTKPVWSTTQNAHYVDESAWVYSPCFDIDSLQRPMISLKYFSNTVSGQDGTVIEYYDRDSDSWKVLGDVNRGLDWYNTNVIAGAPGVQTFAPKGWSGNTDQWQIGRYVLDNLRYNGPLRLRIAFGATGFSGQLLQGFAFDSIYIGERQKNVLLEHFANNNVQNMNSINQTVYNHIYDRNLFPYDLNLMQIHTERDELFNDPQHMQYHNSRIAIYEAATGHMVIDGIAHDPNSRYGDDERRWSEQIGIRYYEERMLQTPEFLIEIGNVIINNGRVRYDYTVSQNPLADSLPDDEKYYIYSAILEDYVPYNNNNKVHSFLRAMKVNADNNQANIITRVNANAPFTYSIDTTIMALSNDTTHSSNLNIVVWVQRINNNLQGEERMFANKVYQSQSSRNVLEYLVSVDEVNSEVEHQAQKMLNANLYPNPAYSYFNVDFEQPIMDNCNWRLIDARGVTLQQGKLNQGDTQVQVLTEEYASGIYTFIVEHAQFKVYKKVVIYRP